MRPRALQVFCALLLTAGIIAWFVWPHYLIWSATNALDRLYVQYRPFPYRWIGAGFSAIKVQESTPGCTAVPEDKLAESQLKIAQAEKRSGQTAQSLQQLGRIDLLLCMPSEAIQKYKLALLLEPDNSSLNLELGVAFAQDASMDPHLERQGALDYEGALEGVLRSARQNQSPEILFDSALLFEEAQLPNQAQERWAQAEKLEHDAKWRAEDQARLAALKRRIGERKQRIINLTTSPDSFLAQGNDSSGDELALGTAVEHWLPEMFDSHSSKLALEHLGSMLLAEHHDRWLLDVIRTKPSASARNAFKNLAFAVRSNVKGEYIHAAALAQDSERFFLGSHNSTGALRAQLEIVYSLDRRSQPKACVSELKKVLSVAEHLGYTWIEAQARLEDITCRTRTREEDVVNSRKEAYDWITAKTGYEGLRLRALGFMTEEYVSADSRLTLWRRGESGLRAFWSQPLPALRGYSFYYTLADSARQAGNPDTAVALLREGALLIKEQDAVYLHAGMLSYLGVRELEAKLFSEADKSFATMREEFARLDPQETAGFEEEHEVIHATALISSGHPAEGLARLQQLTDPFQWPYNELIGDVRRPLLPALGDAYLALNRLPEACSSYSQSINENWNHLQSVNDRAQRNNALHETEPAWRGMTAVLLKFNRPLEALKVWEQFRSSRSITHVQPPLQNPSCLSSTPPTPFPAMKGISILVYALLPGKISGWMIHEDGTVEQHWIEENPTLSLASRFAELVARQNSPRTSISATGHELYSLLLQPFADKLPPNGTLVIDAEGALAGIPWGALEDRGDHPLVERFALCQTIGLAEVLGQKYNSGIDLSRALIFGSPQLQGDLARQYPGLPAAAMEAQKLSLRLPHSVLVPDKEATEDAFRTNAEQATLFHFAGHGISYGGFGALLLASPPGAPPDKSYLSAKEIAGMDLHRMQLVVLSACSSGVGEESGIVNLDSLTMAFLESGAHRVIAANWEVDSRETAHLMAVFYDRLIQGSPPSEALRQGALAVRKTQPHPYYWAGFRVFGAP
jgi:CHAT domain-containing protein/tetratricopeptide (TPR) repeat protein